MSASGPSGPLVSLFLCLTYMFHIHDNVPNKLKCYSVLFYSTNKSCQLLSSFFRINNHTIQQFIVKLVEFYIFYIISSLIVYKVR